MTDYKAWEKFDIEKAIADCDYRDSVADFARERREKNQLGLCKAEESLVAAQLASEAHSSKLAVAALKANGIAPKRRLKKVSSLHITVMYRYLSFI